MSKKNDNDVTVGVSVDDAASDKSMFEETVNWDDLILARKDAVGAVLENQQLVVELTKLKSDAIEENKDTFELVNGLLNTYKELADDIRKISLEHATVTTEVKTPTGKLKVPKAFKSGVIDDNEDELSYIAIATNYVSIVEKVGHITGTSYPGILVKLGMDGSPVEKAYADGVDTTKDVTDGK